MSGSRFLEVSAGRLPGWVERYVSARAGAVRAVVTDTGFDLVGDDGSSASLALLEPGSWAAAGPDDPDGAVVPADLAVPASDLTARTDLTGVAAPTDVAHLEALTDLAALLAAEAGRSRTLLVCLVRRGGWSVGVVRDGVVLTGKTGRRYVQGTTAAGGWSQQRFARRRGGQTDKLADDASSALVRMMAQAPGATGVVVGGDRRLAESVLAGTPAQDLPVLGPIEVGEPRRTDLDAAAVRAQAVRVTVHDAP
ncbi:acVLRF1 family peptidyl-tRNA hydrolase [Aquipuribacter sp. MA13-6]|uniref:acVLRF1 family peptidyl-tRNA hydrolase n=1 Tax=unclassified Aquipuribacter TaxID=2635084 RepID=UPI003EEA5AD1